MVNINSLHMQKPEKEDASNSISTKVNKIINSSYYDYILNTSEEISKSIVKNSIAGSSGYILNLENNINAIVYVDKNVTNLKISKENVSDKDISLINKFPVNNVKSEIDGPYNMDVSYNMSEELKKCHNKPIQGVAIGSNSFSFCFLDSMELETMLFIKDNHIDFSVYWEQW